MEDEKLREIALDEANRMRIAASKADQAGMKALATWLRKNADDAMKWAARPPEKSNACKRPPDTA